MIDKTSIRVRRAPIYEFTDHTHPYIEVTILANGQSINTVNGKEYIMNEGNIIMMPAGTHHEGRSETGFTDLSIAIHNYTNEDFPDVIYGYDADGTALALANMIIRTHLEKGPNYSAVADAMREALVQYIKQISNTVCKYPFTNTFKNLIYEHISDMDFSLPDEIEKCGYNDDYFRRCFKEDTGKTPLEYLTTLRIRRAKELLVSIYFKTVEKAAEQCGFRDSFYFSTCFRKAVGMSPMQYRKMKMSQNK